MNAALLHFSDKELEQQFFEERFMHVRNGWLRVETKVVTRERVVWTLLLLSGFAVGCFEFSGVRRGDPIVVGVITALCIGLAAFSTSVRCFDEGRISPMCAKQLCCQVGTVLQIVAFFAHCLCAKKRQRWTHDDDFTIAVAMTAVAIATDTGCASVAAFLGHEFHFPPLCKVLFCTVPALAHTLAPVWDIGLVPEACTWWAAAAIGTAVGHARESKLRTAFLEGLHGPEKIVSGDEVSPPAAEPCGADAALQPPAHFVAAAAAVPAPDGPLPQPEVRPPAGSDEADQAQECEDVDADEAAAAQDDTPRPIQLRCTGCNLVLQLPPMKLEELWDSEVQCGVCPTKMRVIGLRQRLAFGRE